MNRRSLSENQTASSLPMSSSSGSVPFIPGLELSEGFYRDAVRWLLDSSMPGLRYSAALIGPGSEVLGFDTEMSSDHHWGPRVMLFLEPDDLAGRGNEITALFADKLPFVYRGYPTNWSAPDADDNGAQKLSPTRARPIHHRVELFTIRRFFDDYTGIDIAVPLDTPDWLTLPHQKLRSIVAGRVFHDDLGLKAIRERLSWYPHDLWLYVLASCWSRIGEEEHLTGRAGIVGDERGSAVIAARLVRDFMRLAFLMERTYPPYAKWFGSAFARLGCAPNLGPLLDTVLRSGSWDKRDCALAGASRFLAEMHNTLKITPPLGTDTKPFWGRPFTVIDGCRFADALVGAIRDPRVKGLAEKRLIGNIDLVSDSTDLLEDTTRRRALRALYE